MGGVRAQFQSLGTAKVLTFPSLPVDELSQMGGVREQFQTEKVSLTWVVSAVLEEQDDHRRTR